jgi:protein-S-isoprenylcysteine O-methyltransferase Ste14
MAFSFKVLVFVLATIGLAWLTRASLLNIRSHGFHRFFAFEAILLLVLLNLPHWFHEPFRIHQLVSWLLLVTSAVMAIDGVRLLRIVGKPDRRRSDPSLLGFERTTELVTVGTYRYIRHPLYSSLLFGVWGVFFKNPSWAGVSLAAIATFFLTMTAKREEAENIEFFGAEYQRYARRTKMFVPFFF